jgi:hypothetical protein
MTHSRQDLVSHLKIERLEYAFSSYQTVGVADLKGITMLPSVHLLRTSHPGS